MSAWQLTAFLPNRINGFLNTIHIYYSHRRRHCMSTNCTVYIDEAGDLGIGRGTQWFVLSAVIVNADDEPEIRNIITSIKQRLNIHDIHFRNLRNFEQKTFVISKLANGSFEYLNVIIDTSQLNIKCKNTSDNPSIVTYNFACRLLIERVSWLLRDTDRKGKIVLSSRGTKRDQELIDYINDRLLSFPNNEIANRFTSIQSKPANSWDMLQLADVCATSMFYRFEPNQYGFITPCYSIKLEQKLYRHNGHIDKYGVKYYSDSMKPDKQYFIDKMICR